MICEGEILLLVGINWQEIGSFYNWILKALEICFVRRFVLTAIRTVIVTDNRCIARCCMEPFRGTCHEYGIFFREAEEITAPANCLHKIFKGKVRNR